MIKHGQPMSQVLAQMQVNELKMNDPKLNKVFDKLKPKMTDKLKKRSTNKKDTRADYYKASHKKSKT